MNLRRAVVVSTLWRAWVVRKNEKLDASDAASTLFRLFRSKHVSDLKLIFNVALLVLGICGLVAAFWVIWCLVTAALLTVLHVTALPAPPKGSLLDNSTDSKGISTAIAFLSSLATISAGIMAWAYLTASKRLGVVDLFACEIATLCRVGTIFNVGQQRVETCKRIDRGEGWIGSIASADPSSCRLPGPGNYVSQEDYFPIFDANSQDLETLEALVVSHITEILHIHEVES